MSHRAKVTTSAKVTLVFSHLLLYVLTHPHLTRLPKICLLIP